MADVRADAGCESEDIHFARTSTPIKIYGILADDELGPNGWNGKVEKEGRRYQGIQGAIRLNKSTAKSTHSMLQQGAGRELTGELMSNRKKNGISPGAARDFIQMIGNAFPVAQIVSRNTHQSTCEKCKLCQKATETYPHMQMGCEKTKDARTKCHIMILQEILNAIKAKCPDAEIDNKPKIGDYKPCDDAHLASFEPDSVIQWTDEKGRQWMVITEMTRCLTEKPLGQRSRTDRKRQAYQSSLLHLQRLFPHVTVLQQTFVMSCHGTILQNTWDRQLEFWGMSRSEARKAEKECAKAALLGNHMLASVRRSLLEGLKLGGRAHRPRVGDG